MHASTSAGRHAGLLEQVDGAEEVGEEQAVDDEAGRVGDLDGRLAERLAQRAGARAASSRRPAAGKASSTSSIRGTGLKTCRPDEAVGRARPRRPGRPTDSDEVVVASTAPAPATPAERPQDADLDVVLLGDGLDEEGGRAERGERRSRRARRAASTSSPSLPQPLAIDAVARSAEASERAEQRDVAVARGGGGQATGDGAAARDAELFLHGSGSSSSGLVDWPVNAVASVE